MNQWSLVYHGWLCTLVATVGVITCGRSPLIIQCNWMKLLPNWSLLPGTLGPCKQGKVVPVTGFLHSTEVIPPYALANTKRAEDCEVEVKKGIHLTTFVKDVFPNAGRLTLSLDSSMTKEKARIPYGLCRCLIRMVRLRFA